MILLLIAGVADFGMLFQSFEVTTNAAREGARLAVLPGYGVDDYAAVRTRVDTYLAAAGLKGKHSTTVAAEALDLGGSLRANGVRVTIAYTYEFLFLGPIVGLINGTFVKTITYQAAALMRTEVQAVTVP